VSPGQEPASTRPAALLLPPQSLPVDRGPTRTDRWCGGDVGPAFVDPCDTAASYEEWLECRSTTDPLVLY
jgi:hypothetical protein